MFKNVVISSLLAATIVAASPTPATSRTSLRGVTKRWEDGVDCTMEQSLITDEEGWFHAIDAEGLDIACEDVDEMTTPDRKATCYRSKGDGSLGQIIKCPGDPAPSRNPDGSDVDEDLASGVMSAYCGATGGGGPVTQFASTIGCLMFGYYEAQGDPVAEAEAGAMGICDMITSGACNWFINIAEELQEGMSRPCPDEETSPACDFANPGK